MALELRGICKRFGAVTANDDVSLRVEPGERHGLLGENGAGKSTLVRVLSGYVEADAGTIVLDGEPLTLRSPRDALAAGIGILHQDPLVVPSLTVIENFLLGAPGGVRLDRAAGARELARVCAEFGFDLPPDVAVSTLTVGERQQLEIARLLGLGTRVLILDEPTTAISDAQRDRLFETIRRLAARGMSLIFVSHKLEEVETICERVTVLRRGRVVGARALPCPLEELVALMFGQAVEPASRATGGPGRPRLRLKGLSARDGTAAITDVSCELRRGEIVGLAGLEGSGQRVLLRTLAGLVRAGDGRVVLDGEDVTRAGYRERMSAGIHYLPADRLGEGLVSGLTIAELVALGDERGGALIDWPAGEQRARDLIERFSIRGTTASTPESLSGGNQQRLLLALMPEQPRLVLLDQPTRGLDVGSAAWVWGELGARAARGTTVLFASSDVDELLGQSDRIMVCFAGRVIETLDARSTSGERLGALIAGLAGAMPA